MRNFYNAIGLVGSGDASAGCGILTVINSKEYVLTCEHILHELSNNNPWFLFGLTRTRYPIGGFLRFPFSVVQRFPLADSALLLTDMIQGGDYLNFGPITLAPGDRIYAYGYPVAETVKAISENRDEPLLPIRKSGIFIGYKEHVTLGNKSNELSINVNNVGIIRMEGSDFAGYSGGLVATEDNRAIGIIVGENASNLMFVPVNNIQSQNFPKLDYLRMNVS